MKPHSHDEEQQHKWVMHNADSCLSETERPLNTVNPLVADVQLDTWLLALRFNHSLSECAFTGQKMNHWFHQKK